MGTCSFCTWILAYLLPQEWSWTNKLNSCWKESGGTQQQMYRTSSEDSACSQVALKCAPLCILAHFYLKKLWFSTQTFHSLLADRWFCSLNPTVLSNCSVCRRRNSFAAVLRGLVAYSCPQQRLPLLVWFLCKSCSSCRKSLVFWARQTDLFEACLCKLGVRWHTLLAWYPHPQNPAKVRSKHRNHYLVWHYLWNPLQTPLYGVCFG